MVIELLYSKFKNCLFTKLIWIYFVQFFTFHAIIWVTEFSHENNASHRNDDQDSGFSENTKRLITNGIAPILTVINLIVVLLLIHNQLKYFKSMKSRILSSIGIWLDMVYILANAYLLLHSKYNVFRPKVNEDDQNIGQRLFYFREGEVIAVITIYLKGLTYLRLINAVAPLIDTMISILKDIRYFLLIISIFLSCFSICFFLLG